MAVEARRLEAVESVFGIEAAGRLLTEVLAALDAGARACWSRRSKSGRPAGAPPDWQPGAVIRLPFSAQALPRRRLVCPQALMALADTAMMLACAAAWNGYRPMSAVDQTMHFLRPVNFDVLADARIVRIGRTTSFGRVMLSSAVDRRPVGMVSSAYAML